MFNLFKKDDRSALRKEIAHRIHLFENAMARYGVNSSQAREFDRQISELEYRLQAA